MVDSVGSIEAGVRATPTQLAYSRALKQLIGITPRRHRIRVGVLSAATLHPAETILQVELGLLGLDAEFYWGAYNQFEVEILNQGSGLIGFSPDILVILPSSREWSVDSSSVRTVCTRLVELATMSRETFRVPVLLCNLDLPNAGDVDAYLETNRVLANETREVHGVAVVDVAAAQRAVGTVAWCDERLWYTARMALGMVGQIALARCLARALRAALLGPHKVLVVDLDDTLWGGILGEDGIAGIQLGGSYPGNVYTEIQRSIRGYRDRGILLAINSKNDESLVRQAFEQHTAMELRFDDFAAARINWADKSQNLREIARDLGLGIDSFVFVDDDPAQIALVRHELPEVVAVHLNGNPLEKLARVRALPWLDSMTTTPEDRVRSEQYRVKAAADQLRVASSNLDEYYEKLEMVLDISPVRNDQISRVGQLTRKTNQFNLTTLRLSDAEVAFRVTSPNHELYAVSLRDRFGDHGLTAICGVVGDRNSCEIELFLLSCRILGRGVERAVLARVVQDARERGVETIQAAYVPTERNSQTQEFYPDAGFSLLERTECRVLYSLTSDAPFAEPPCWFSYPKAT